MCEVLATMCEMLGTMRELFSTRLSGMGSCKHRQEAGQLAGEVGRCRGVGSRGWQVQRCGQPRVAGAEVWAAEGGRCRGVGSRGWQVQRCGQPRVAEVWGSRGWQVQRCGQPSVAGAEVWAAECGRCRGVGQPRAICEVLGVERDAHTARADRRRLARQRPLLPPRGPSSPPRGLSFHPGALRCHPGALAYHPEAVRPRGRFAPGQRESLNVNYCNRICYNLLQRKGEPFEGEMPDVLTSVTLEAANKREP
eukprot:366155-Chlamydomonas_euryale.AAC.5